VQVLESIPVNINGLALGVIGLGVTWQTAAGIYVPCHLPAAGSGSHLLEKISEILAFPPPLKLLTDLISLVALNIAGSLILLYFCKVCTRFLCPLRAILPICLVVCSAPRDKVNQLRRRQQPAHAPHKLRTRMTCACAAHAQMLAAPAAFRRDLDKPDTCALLCTLDMALMSLSWVRRALALVHP